MGVSRKFKVILWGSQRYSKSLKGVSGKFQLCFNIVSRGFQGSFMGIPRKILGCFTASQKFKESFKGVARKIEGCFNGVVSGCQGCVKKVQWVFEESFKGV